MSKSNRRGHIAIGVAALMALVAIGFAYSSVSKYRVEHREEREDAAANYSEQSAQIQKDCLERYGSAEDRAACIAGESKAHSEQQWTTHDLRAQQEMAEWAFAMFIATCFGVAVTGVGVVYVARTLRATVDMVEQTKLANAAAAKGAEATEKMVLLERPWIVLDKMEMEEGTGTVNSKPFDGNFFMFVWTNAGRSPAKNIKTWASHEVMPITEKPKLFKHSGDLTQKTPPLAPGGVFTNGPIPIDKEVMAGVIARRLRVVIWCMVEYNDTLAENVVRHTQVCLDAVYQGHFTPKDGGPSTPRIGYISIGDQNDGS